MLGTGRLTAFARRTLVGAVVGMVSVAGGFSTTLLAGHEQRAKSLIEGTCAGCHKFTGAPESRFKLKAPDLMWAGSKFKREWLIGWLTGKEETMYPKGYRWDLGQQPGGHMVVSAAEAEAIADYFEQHLVDPRVKAGAIDLSTFSEIEAEFGRPLFKEHACIACHQIVEDDKRVGGPQSTYLGDAGRRLKADWIYRFNLHPPDFVPDSGEFVADVSGLELRYITGFIATRGLEDFRFYEPWKSGEFQHASVERGASIYKHYCAQCHGFSGQSDGPAVSGLEPKPAIHANIPFEKLPDDYLYNVIYYGGKGVGKSPLMPYWGLTLGQQGVADVIAYLEATFKKAEVAEAAPPKEGKPLGVCPQPRKTKKAPEKFLKMTNPLPASSSRVKAGEALYQKTAKPLACAQCHGEKGDGRGLLGAAMIPPPRNFTCGKSMNEIPDGQLFWIIKNGSPGTGMMAFPGLSDEEVWQLIHYLRTLAR